MRILSALRCDVRYQLKYGFYFLYLAMSALYVGVLALLPAGVKQAGAALIILTDPAALGFLFIGGILLLERGEGLHSYLSITPLKASEYVLSKVLSLALISTLAGGAIAGLGLLEPVDYPLMIFSLLVGSATFTLFGLAIGSSARSVNHYLTISIPVELVLLAPPVLTVFGLNHPLLEWLPGSLLIRALYAAVGLTVPYHPLLAIAGLLFWLLPAYWWAKRSFLSLQQPKGGRV